MSRRAAAGVRSGRVGVPRQQACPNRRQAVERKHVGHGACGSRCPRFQQLRQGIQTIGGDEPGWRPRQEVRIDQRIGRDQPVVPERALEAVRAAPGDDRVAGHLAPRARRRGHGHEWDRWPAIWGAASDAFDVLHDRRARPRESSDRLGHVQDAASAHAHDHVRREVASHGGVAVDELRSGLCHRPHVAGERDPPFLQATDEALELVRRKRSLAGDEEQPGTQVRHDIRQVLDDARSEPDPGQPCDGERHRRRQPMAIEHGRPSIALPPRAGGAFCQRAASCRPLANLDWSGACAHHGGATVHHPGGALAASRCVGCVLLRSSRPGW